jgi:hypothetical protein
LHRTDKLHICGDDIKIAIRVAGNISGLGCTCRVLYVNLSPASYDLGSQRYELKLIVDCFGEERLEEYRGKGMLDLCLVYGAEPRILTQAPGELLDEKFHVL